LWSSFQTGLQRFCGSMRYDIPTQHTMRVSIYYRQNIDFVFFSPT
jgi:hypothetical protein